MTTHHQHWQQERQEQRNIWALPNRAHFSSDVFNLSLRKCEAEAKIKAEINAAIQWGYLWCQRCNKQDLDAYISIMLALKAVVLKSSPKEAQGLHFAFSSLYFQSSPANLRLIYTKFASKVQQMDASPRGPSRGTGILAALSHGTHSTVVNSQCATEITEPSCWGCDATSAAQIHVGC